MYFEGGPFCDSENIAQGNGMEAIRVIVGSCELNMAQSKRTYLRNDMQIRQVKRVENMDAIFQSLGRNIKRYEYVAGKTFDKYLLVIALSDACVPELRSKLELSSKNVCQREARYWHTSNGAETPLSDRSRWMSRARNNCKKTKALTMHQSSRSGEEPTTWAMEVGRTRKVGAVGTSSHTSLGKGSHYGGKGKGMPHSMGNGLGRGIW